MDTMLTDWTRWLTSLEFSQICLILLPILLIDAPTGEDPVAPMKYQPGISFEQ